jgi:hypothetical protein
MTINTHNPSFLLEVNVLYMELLVNCAIIKNNN